MQTVKPIVDPDFVVRGAVRVIEVVGVSEKSFEDAVKSGLEQVAESITGITGIEVLHQTAQVEENHITQYHVDMRIAYGLKSRWPYKS